MLCRVGFSGDRPYLVRVRQIVSRISLADVRRNLHYARWFSPVHARSFFPAMGTGRFAFC